MKHPSYLFPLLVVTTVIHCFEVIAITIGGLLFIFGFSLMFHDDPNASLFAPTPGLFLLLLLLLLIPIALIACQWTLYRRGRDRAALIVTLIGLTPTAFAFMHGVSSRL